MTLYKPADLDADGDIVDGSGAIEWDTVDPILFQFDADNNRVLRVSMAGVRVLANDVTALTFEDQSFDIDLGADDVRITMSIQKRTSRGLEIATTATRVVQLRN
jgi:hypothetical protein